MSRHMTRQTERTASRTSHAPSVHSPAAHLRRLVHPKLTVSRPGDVYEREADRVADEVMRMPDPAVAGLGIDPAPIRPLVVQRRCSECEEEVQRRAQGSRADTEVPSLDATLRRTGHPLDAAARAFFEPRFGFDFGHVRVHTDSSAAQAAQSIDALAFTFGSDVVFGSGQYAPQTAEGRGLIAHELAHVIQQTGERPGGGRVQGKLVEHRATAPQIQAKWRLDSVRADSGIDAHKTKGNASAIVSLNDSPSQNLGGAYGGAFTHQEQGFVHQQEGGVAQVADWVTKHYIFKNDGTDSDLLQLYPVGQLDGDAKAEDLRYARAGAVVWGRITKRTKADTTPPDEPLFQIEDGGISAATVGSLGEIEADIPLGERGSVTITIPLKKVDEGSFVPFSDAAAIPYTVPNSIDEVDVVLGARIEADADIETAFTGLSPWISTNHNNAQANGRFRLAWESRPAPGSEPRAAGDELETQDRFKGDCYSGRNCDGKLLQKRVLHCHNCKKHVSGRSILRPDGTCEKC